MTAVLALQKTRGFTGTCFEHGAVEIKPVTPAYPISGWWYCAYPEPTGRYNCPQPCGQYALPGPRAMAWDRSPFAMTRAKRGASKLHVTLKRAARHQT